MKDGTFDRARALHIQGRLAEAEALYREVLQARPDAVWSLEGLGVLVFQQGRAEEAAALFGAVWECGRIRFACTPTWVKLFESWVGLMRPSTTCARHWRWMPALRKRGTAWACSRTISGVLPMRSGRAGRRSGSTLGSQRLTSTWAMAQALHRPVEAVEAMRTALRIEPDNSLGLTNLGQVLSELGDPDLLDEAEVLCHASRP